ncbi:hypothetical protein P6F26_11580 [Roseibacterium sp. SDUM158017]|uniref:hypothetical protein n=1 Tax=Roseicyclus salinarum TaxID=3036773 RepID=UPI00241523A4|nr:hypothetical protein [Roseibacterium sp. SDUM158017]MDG4649087.1 hypothetical protein [Roseibacterium sp. SDUM158017]
MVRFHRYGLTFVFVLCCCLGAALGASLGVGGAVFGAVLGAMAAAGVATLLDTAEKLENAAFCLLSVVFAVALVWLSLTIWDFG